MLSHEAENCSKAIWCEQSSKPLRANGGIVAAGAARARRVSGERPLEDTSPLARRAALRLAGSGVIEPPAGENLAIQCKCLRGFGISILRWSSTPGWCRCIEDQSVFRLQLELRDASGTALDKRSKNFRTATEIFQKIFSNRNFCDA